ncbi:hypothetical protein GCM10027591_00810 [Zhihengliuella somnathii]
MSGTSGTEGKQRSCKCYGEGFLTPSKQAAQAPPAGRHLLGSYGTARAPNFLVLHVIPFEVLTGPDMTGPGIEHWDV